MIPFLLSLTALFSYFLGNVSGAAVASRFVFHKELRAPRDRLPGLRECYRAFGLRGVLLVLGAEAAKSALAVLLGSLLLGLEGQSMVGRLFAGFCLLLGCMYPILNRFRGGKSLIPCAVTALLVDWRVGLGCLAVFFVVVVFTRYISLGTMLAAGFCPLLIWMTGYETLDGVLAVFIAALVLVKHAENILRLIGRTEPRLRLKSDPYGRSGQT